MPNLFASALIVLAIDQVTKFYVINSLNLRELGSIELFPPFLNLRMAWNRGINFGIFAADSEYLRWLFVGIAAAISIALIWWGVCRAQSSFSKAMAGCVVGGAAGNAADRISEGAVADFLNVSCCGIENPWVFNFADIGIVCGALGIALFSAKLEHRS
ncbi:MAG: signal peptidase II [Albidovulum sp.]|nr:signal peptidase II [Albidovulum sp.]MDE0530339.1 signal peptidase II [Albidovulum sp.]